MTAPWGNLGKPGHVNRGDEWEALLDYVGGPPTAQLRQTSGQSISNGAFTALTFDAEDFDSHNGHSTTTNTSRYTAQVAGRYQLAGKHAWPANATGQRASQWYVNGGAISGSQAAWPAVAAVERQYAAATMTVLLAANDYVELQVFQDSGGSLTTSVATAQVQSYVYIKWIGLT